MSSAVQEERAGADVARLRETPVERSLWHDARYQAFMLLRLGFTAAPIAFGLDKFWNQMVYWPKYLAPWIDDLMPGSAQQFMYFVAAWLAGIVINLFSFPGWYDIAVRDFGLMLGALTLARLASVYDPPIRLRR